MGWEPDKRHGSSLVIPSSEPELIYSVAFGVLEVSSVKSTPTCSKQLMFQLPYPFTFGQHISRMYVPAC